MFSSRTEWHLEENRLTRLLRECTARGDAILDLTETNPTRCGFLAPSWLLESISTTSSLFYEPDPKGLPEARSALARWYGARGLHVNPDSIFLTASTSEAYYILFRLLCNSGDEVLLPRPGYPLFDILASLSDIRIVPYDLRYDGEWHFDIESIRAGMSDRTRAIVIVTPNNPTGSFLKKDEWREIEAMAINRHCAVIADEVFSAFHFEKDPQRIASLSESSNVLTFTLNGLSKLAGLPQMKLAWMTVSGPETEYRPALNRLELISDTLLSVATPIQRAVPLILQEIESFTAPILTRVSHNESVLRSRVDSASGVSVFRLEGGWNAIVRVPATRSDEDWALELLQSAGVLVHPGHLFDCAMGTCLVISLLPAHETFAKAIDRIVKRFTAGT